MSVGVGLCRIVGRSDMCLFLSCQLSLSLWRGILSLHKLTLTLTSSNKHNRVQIWAWEEQ